MHLIQTKPSHHDVWADWLLEARNAGDTDYESAIAARVKVLADRVLDGIDFVPGMVLLDMGAGCGTVGLRAIERWGTMLRVVFADQSERLLRHAARSAAIAGVSGQCAYVRCAANDLASLTDQSIDAVVTRAILVYLPDKVAATRAIWRVLKPGGMVSIGEPNFQEQAIQAIALRLVYEARQGAEIEPLLPLLCRWRGAQFPDTVEKMAADPMTNFTSQNLGRWLEDAGFALVKIEDVTHPVEPFEISWDVFVGRSPHPMAPPLRKIMRDTFSAAERLCFENLFRPRMAQNHIGGERMIYVKGQKPCR